MLFKQDPSPTSTSSSILPRTMNKFPAIVEPLTIKQQKRENGKIIGFSITKFRKKTRKVTIIFNKLFRTISDYINYDDFFLLLIFFFLHLLAIKSPFLFDDRRKKEKKSRKIESLGKNENGKWKCQEKVCKKYYNIEILICWIRITNKFPIIKHPQILPYFHVITHLIFFFLNHSDVCFRRKLGRNICISFWFLLGLMG